MNRIATIGLACLVTQVVNGQDLPTETQAKFLKVLLASSGQFGFGCTDPALKAQLEANGISVSPGFKMAWAISEGEVKALKSAGKLVIVPKLAWLKAGGSIALVQEGGKPCIYLNMANVKASGMELKDTIVKMAKTAN